MTIIEGVRDWLKGYPGLKDGRLNVDFLPEKARSWSVDVVPCKEVVKAYLDGSAVKQFLFVVASRDFHGADLKQNTGNLAFYEDFARWVEGQSRERVLPLLGEGRTARRVEVATSGYPFLVDEHGTARYQIQLKLTYYEGRGRTPTGA